MVLPPGRRIRDARKIVSLLSLLERIVKTLDLRGKPLTHQFAKLVVVVFRIMVAVGAVILRQDRWRDVQCRADGAKIVRESLEAHDAVDIGKRIFFTRTQPKIVWNRYSFGNNPPEFLSIPSFWT